MQRRMLNQAKVSPIIKDHHSPKSTYNVSNVFEFTAPILMKENIRKSMDGMGTITDRSESQ